MKKNVILVMTDQQRFDMRKSKGFAFDTTPFLDSQASSGVDFGNAYTSCPLCVPARTSLLTGRYPSANRVRGNSNFYKNKPVCSTDLYEYLHDNKITVANIGKEHTYKLEHRTGIDYFYNIDDAQGFTDTQKKSKALLDQLHNMCSRQPHPYRLEDTAPYILTTKAIQFIQNQAAEQNPFFLKLSFIEPHSPYYAPEPYYSMFRNACPSMPWQSRYGTKRNYQFMLDKWKEVTPDLSLEMAETRCNYLAMIRMIDDQMHRLYRAVGDLQLLESTTFIFLSDHGDFAGDCGLLRKGTGLDELLCHIPMVFWGDGVKPQSEGRQEHVSIADVFPTICSLFQLPVPDGVQGRSLAQILKGEAVPQREFASSFCENGIGGTYYSMDEAKKLSPEAQGYQQKATINELNAVTQAGSQSCVVKNGWKLEIDMMGNTYLYNLVSDPFEINNLADSAEAKEILQEMMHEMIMWTLRTRDELPVPDVNSYPLRHLQDNYYWTEEVK
jgi:arylsulfatase A-like enzyme